MGIVIDSSVAACWALPDEYSDLANQALDLVQIDGMIVPSIFWYEVRNVLVVNARRNRLSMAQVSQALALFDALPQSIEHPSDQDPVIGLAQMYDLTIYDAAYLELSLRKRMPIATLDKRLASAAKAEGAQVIA